MHSRLRFILRHAVEYGALMRWLFGQAFSAFGSRIVQSALLSVASVVVELFSFALVVKLLGILESEGSEGLSALLADYGMPAWSVPAALLAPSIVFIVAGYLHYRSRTVAIALQSGVSMRLSDSIIQRLGKSISPIEGDSLPFGLDRRALLRTVSTDTMFCGIAVRQTLTQAISIPYLFVGVAILGVLAPGLLLLWLVALGLVLPVLYLLNLKALGDARELGDVAPQYRRQLIGRVQTMLGGTLPASDATDLAARYVSAFDGRLRVSEGARMALVVVFGAAIAVFFMSALHPKLQPSFNSTSLILLFLALRYAYQGLQGLSVLVSVINRFLPSLMRVHEIDRKLGLLEVRADRLDQMRAAGSGTQEFRYKIAGGAVASDSATGVFATGKSYAVLSYQAPRLGTAGQILAVLNPPGSRIAFIVSAGKAPEIVGGTVSRVARAAPLPDWMAELSSTANEGDGAGEETVRSFLENVSALSRADPRIVFLDGNILAEFPHEAQTLILNHLARHLVFVLTNRFPYIDVHPFDALLISDGQSILRLVSSETKLTREQRLDLRKLLSARRPKPDADDGAGPASLDQEDDDVIG